MCALPLLRVLQHLVFQYRSLADVAPAFVSQHLKHTAVNLKHRPFNFDLLLLIANSCRAHCRMLTDLTKDITHVAAASQCLLSLNRWWMNTGAVQVLHRSACELCAFVQYYFECKRTRTKAPTTVSDSTATITTAAITCLAPLHSNASSLERTTALSADGRLRAMRRLRRRQHVTHGWTAAPNHSPTTAMLRAMAARLLM